MISLELISALASRSCLHWQFVFAHISNLNFKVDKFFSGGCKDPKIRKKKNFILTFTKNN